MPVHNAEIAEVFNELADRLEIQDANPFRVRAYRIAAQTVVGLPRDVPEMLKCHEDLSKLPGIGKDLAGKICQIVNEGTLDLLEQVRRQTPGELSSMMKLPGLGAKRVKLIYDKLGVKDLRSLAQAAEKHHLRAVRGLGAKTEQKILDEIKQRQQREVRCKLSDAIAVGESLVAYLRKVPGVRQVAIAGSYRRQRETVGDLDILATCAAAGRVMKQFAAYDEVKTVLAQGKTKSTFERQDVVNYQIQRPLGHDLRLEAAENPRRGFAGLQALEDKALPSPTACASSLTTPQTGAP